MAGWVRVFGTRPYFRVVRAWLLSRKGGMCMYVSMTLVSVQRVLQWRRTHVTRVPASRQPEQLGRLGAKEQQAEQ